MYIGDMAQSDYLEDVDRQVLSRVKRAQECRKRRDWDALRTHLDSAERLLEKELDTNR